MIGSVTSCTTSVNLGWCIQCSIFFPVDKINTSSSQSPKSGVSYNSFEFVYYVLQFRKCSMILLCPVKKLSRTITSWPSFISLSVRWDPTKPAPPVIRIFLRLESGSWSWLEKWLDVCWVMSVCMFQGGGESLYAGSFVVYISYCNIE